MLRFLMRDIDKLWFCCLFLLCLLMVGRRAHAQNLEKHFRHISVDHGLSQSTVLSLAQDTLGFVWMATKDGLNRYDGRRFSVYRNQEGLAQSISSGYISCVYLDREGRLWIGGDRGISRYNYDTDDFQNFKVPNTSGEWSISWITEDEHGEIWATSTGGGIFTYSATEQKFNQVNIDPGAYGIKYISFIIAWKGKFLLGTRAGLYIVDSTKGRLQAVNLGTGQPDATCAYNNGDTLFVGTEGEGVFVLNKDLQIINNYRHTSDPASLANNNVRSLCKDQFGNIWMGTFRGLSVLDQRKKTFSNYYHQVSQPFTLSQNSVRCIYRDRQNGMWLGTYYGGTNYYHSDHIKFNLLSQRTGALSLNDEVVSAIKEDNSGNIWIGTNDKGINIWDRAAGRIRYLTAKSGGPDELSSNNIKALMLDGKGLVYIGTHGGGLNVLDRNTGKIRHYKHDNKDLQSISGDLVYALLQDTKDQIWVGTYSGLDRFDPHTGTFSHFSLDNARRYLRSDEITSLFQDSKGRIWIGTTGGVAVFYLNTQIFAQLSPSRLTDDVITCITEDKKGRIWIGSRRGISLYDEVKRTFITKQERKKFITGTVYGIVPDDTGDLWISTNHGLIQFNPDDSKITNYDAKDGLQNNQFNEYAYCRTRDGMIIFGGIDGLSYFYPSWVKQVPVQLQLRFTGLEVLGRNIVPNDGSDILKDPLDRIKNITLGPGHKQFSIFFNSFNYLSANRTYYFYKLDGVDKEWQKTEDPKVSYSNVPAGNYLFWVKAVGPNGEESIIKKLNIRILPVWYKSGWFTLLTVCLLLALGYLAYRIITERIHTRHQLKVERMEREKVQYINQMKMDFFTNVSHELRTPLTLLLAPLEELISKSGSDKWLRKQLELMLGNARRLYHLVDQLFEFKKTEMGTRKLRVRAGDIVIFVENIYESFKPLAEKKGIDYSYMPSASSLNCLFDGDAIEKILFNLLSNAFKYTGKGQSISLTLSQKDENVILAVKDTGSGIASDQHNKVFERFYQIEGKEANLGSGIGLAFTKRLVELHHGDIYVESEPHKGSTFFVLLPLTESAYDGEVADPIGAFALNAGLITVDQDEQPLAVNAEEDDNVGENKEANVLIVDDNEDILEFLRSFLSDSFRIMAASDGQKALELLEQHPFDMVLSDVMMPELDGLHLCKRIKQNINTSHIPVILLTAKSETSQQIKGFEMGADDYVTKPFSPQLLKVKLSNLIRSRRRLREYYAASHEILPEKIAFNSLDEEFLKDAITIVEKHLSDSDFSIDKFSKEIGMSRSNLYVKFKAITGESATDFIKRIRFTKAVELMQSKRYTIAQVAYMCGFNSPSYFSTAFKQHYGCMPSEYRA